LDPTTAFDRLVAEHSGSVRRLCHSLVRDEHLGDDAVQETFVRLWRQLAKGRPESVSAWLRRAAVSASLDLLRRRRVRDETARVVLERAGTSDVVDGAEPADRAADRELRRRYEAALADLSEGQRTVFLLRHEGGLPLREVAEALGIALPTAKTHLARACLRLQDRLAPFREESSPRGPIPDNPENPVP